MPDDETTPSERTIGEGVRSDGPNGQSSTPQNASSLEELNETSDPIRRRAGDQGWLNTGMSDEDTTPEPRQSGTGPGR
jgi:hypothetical protein